MISCKSTVHEGNNGKNDALLKEDSCLTLFREGKGKKDHIATVYIKENQISSVVNYSTTGFNKLDSLNIIYNFEAVKLSTFYFSEGSDNNAYHISPVKNVKYETEVYKDSILMGLCDKYNLSNLFIGPVRFLNSIKPINKKDSIKPTLFMEYGIDYDAVLVDYNYEIKNGFFIKDEFFFLNGHIKRWFKYNNNILESIDIEVLEDSIKSSIKEFFKVR